ncbi:hypothetical protein TI05_08470 [Achromatium sp. WMS3]|nr:hypothetical protein TI05_08470 [Achromatium sp. WMS3]
MEHSDSDNYSYSLKALLQGIMDIAPVQDRYCTNLTVDSRDVISGGVFCALQGHSKHGLEFAKQAQAQGAVAILAEISSDEAQYYRYYKEELIARLDIPVLEIVDLKRHLNKIAGRFYGNPSDDLELLGVTGTNGKTSVCQFVSQSLNAISDDNGNFSANTISSNIPNRSNTSCGVIGTLGYGFPDQLTTTGWTTPNAIHIQSILAELKTKGATTVAMEVSSHALDQGRVTGLPITTAILTNITRDHIDYHRNLGAYARTKQQLFKMQGLQYAILNAQDPFGLSTLAILDKTVQPVLYSLDPSFVSPRFPQRQTIQWLKLAFLEYHPKGMRLWINSSWGEGNFSVPILGRFNAANLLATLAVLLIKGYSLETSLQCMEKIQGVPGRLECFSKPSQPLVIVDYAHTPDALKQVLEVLQAHQPQRIITVFGCGGERDRGKRSQMGTIAENMSDQIILTDDNPRSESGKGIIQDILSGMEKPNKVYIEQQRGRAIRQAIKLAAKGDIVLIAGKGHETTQRIGDLEYPFSDRAEVAKILSENSM